MNWNYKKMGFWSLRIGLAAVYLYSGPDLIAYPQNWVGYLPEWFKGLLPIAPELYLKIQGIAELLMVISFLSGIAVRWAALASALEMAGILMFYGIDGVSFRDLAVLGSALSLFFFASNHEEIS